MVLQNKVALPGCLLSQLLPGASPPLPAAVVLQKMGASSVVATDLEPNLPLLQENCDTNGVNWWCEGV